MTTTLPRPASAATDPGTGPATDPGTDPLHALGLLDRIDLAELTERASLQTRVDRKYVVPLTELPTLLAGLEPGARVLEIDGGRSFAYESVYFDTPELDSYLGAARRRRRRYKVRTRTYVDSALCWVEVKTRGPRGCTVKTRLPHDVHSRAVLTGDATVFTHHVLSEADVAPPSAEDEVAGTPLAPTLVSRYRRTTIHLPATDSRTTIDTDLEWIDPVDGERITFDGYAIVETKTGSTPSSTDRLLWRHGHRPVRISKYGTGMAVLHPDLPATPWRRVLDRHVLPAVA